MILTWNKALSHPQDRLSPHQGEEFAVFRRSTRMAANWSRCSASVLLMNIRIS